jgi:hypothetical protein
MKHQFMAGKSKSRGTKKAVSKKTDSAHEGETMSQQQNRYGKGRQQSGSDGSSPGGRGSNH